MAMFNVTKRTGLAVLAALMLLVPVLPGAAQDRPSQRHIRSYIPPDQLVSFLPSTPFEQFVDFINPIFSRVTGKQVIDPESRKTPIGVSIAGLHYFDAFELVLEYHGLMFRETDRYFIVESGRTPDLVQGAAQATSRSTAGSSRAADLLASLDSREIQIDAVLFEVNQSKARELGINWDVVFGDSRSQSGGTGGTGTGGTGTGGQQGRFQIRTERIFEPLEDILLAPASLPLSDVFRVLETTGVGETIANPTVTVQSAEKGRIQIGSDVPIQTRDFSGNTITQFFSTGIIVDVTPTLITQAVADTAGSPTLDFIHLDVAVEKSSSRPSLSGPVIDRNVANTKVLLLHGEQTVIGGLYSTEESITRRGIPVLKDLPPWFFGLRYVFGYEQVTTAQKELLIVLQARVVDPIRVRAQRPIERNLLEERRMEIRRNLDQFSEDVSSEVALPGGY
jgi:hypothetical protein